MRGFGKFYKFGRKTRFSAQQKAEILVNYIPESYKKRTTFDEEQNEIEYILSNEDLIKELLENYNKYKSKSKLSKLFKGVYSENGNYEYVDYISKLQYQKINSKGSFYNTYKNELYNGKKIKTWLEEFRLGLISKDDMNYILSEFKAKNEKYKTNGSP